MTGPVATTTAATLLDRLPGEVTPPWPQGLRSVVGLQHDFATWVVFWESQGGEKP